MQKIIKIKKSNKKILEEESQRRLLKSEEDFENRRYVDAQDLYKEWDRKYGVPN